MNPSVLWPPIYHVWPSSCCELIHTLTSFRVAHTKVDPCPQKYLESCSFSRGLFLNMAINTKKIVSGQVLGKEENEMTAYGAQGSWGVMQCFGTRQRP